MPRNKLSEHVPLLKENCRLPLPNTRCTRRPRCTDAHGLSIKLRNPRHLYKRNHQWRCIDVTHLPTAFGGCLAKLLALLGSSRIANNLNQLAKAVNIGSLPVVEETEKDIRSACADVAVMRKELLRALGQRSDLGSS